MSNFLITCTIGAVVRRYYITIDRNNIITTVTSSTNPGLNIIAPSGTGIGLPFSNDPPLADNRWVGFPNCFSDGGVNFRDASLQTLVPSNNTSLFSFAFPITPPAGRNRILLETYQTDAQGNNTSGAVEQAVVVVTAIPNSSICFPAGTLISTKQGKIPIEKIDPEVHKIKNKKIVAITQTITDDKYLVCFDKNALENKFPSEKTIMSKDHKVYFRGEQMEAYKFVEKYENVRKIKYNNEILYNVLLEEYSSNILEVNNLTCETLDPENIVAKLYTENFDSDYKNNIIVRMNDCILKQDYPTYKKIVRSIVKK
jgi:hypothetical protein